MPKSLKIALPLLFIIAAVLLLPSICTNSPWPTEYKDTNTLFNCWSSAIKSLDTATAYFEHEGVIINNIVETPVTYDYLARPYKLIPLLATEMPEPVYFDKDGKILEKGGDSGVVDRVEYTIHLHDDVYFQPHPCFGDGVKRLLTAADFKVGLTRLADPRLASPVFTSFSSFLLGFQECSNNIKKEVERLEALTPGTNFDRYPVLPDYRSIPLQCFEQLDDFTFKIVLSRKYPQALYWMAMHFFAPVAWEALEYYYSPENIDKGMSYTFSPVGTGEFMLGESDLNNRIVLERNPNSDRLCPGSIDRVVFQYEREAIPLWLKFLQGYYDRSGIPSDMFEAAVDMSPGGEFELSGELAELGVSKIENVSSWIFYFGFNMLDEDVGGLSPEKRALRQAISIVLDYDEYLSIFQNGRGIAAQELIPPTIFGSQSGEAGVNPYTDVWDPVLKKPRRRSVQEAQELMRQAGYPEGRKPDGTPLVLYLDHASSGLPGFKTQFLWLRDKFRLLGIELEERPSDLNRWRDKIRQGNWQLVFNKGWIADYPDPENFMFLFKGANGVVKSHGRGANYVNYASDEFDEIFNKLESMDNTPERFALLRQATAILQRDAPCCWGFHPTSMVLAHSWVKNYQIHDMMHNTYKYLSIDYHERDKAQHRWNRPLSLIK